MRRIDEYIKEEKLENDVYLILQVHDELVYEIKSDISEKVSKKIKEIMESIIDPKDTMGIKLKANYAIGKNWGELK
jgi:DNA polymerase-1